MSDKKHYVLSRGFLTARGGQSARLSGLSVASRHRMPVVYAEVSAPLAAAPLSLLGNGVGRLAL